MTKAQTLSANSARRLRTAQQKRQAAGSEVSINACAQGYAELAVQALVDVFTDKAQPAAARIAAAKVILDRGYGRLNDSVELVSASPLDQALDRILAGASNGSLGTILPASARKTPILG